MMFNKPESIYEMAYRFFIPHSLDDAIFRIICNNPYLPFPDLHGDRNFIANKSQLILEQDETLTKAYQGQSIQDVSIDACQEALFLVDKGSLFRSNLSSIERN